MEEVASQEAKTIKKKKSLIGRIFTIFFGVLIAILLIVQISGTISASSNYGVQRFGDYQVLVVVTDSMEPSIKVGEGIFVKKTPLNEIQDGDIITFYKPNAPIRNMIITHRVVEIRPQEDGSFDFITLGDNLNAQTCPVEGCDPEFHTDYVKGEYVLGVVVGQSYAFGQFFKITSNPIAIAAVAIVPLLYVFISSVIDVIKHSSMKEEAVDLDEIDEFEALKQREKLRILIEMEKDKLRQEKIDSDLSELKGDGDDGK